MAEKNKTIIEEALMDMKNIEAAIKANSKEILRSILKEEIEGYVKESMSEDDKDYDEEEIGVDNDEIATDDELPTDEFPVDAEAGGEEEVAELPIGGGEEEVSDDDELPVNLDMTGASDDDVIAVYKKLSGDDEIEVVSDKEVRITDPVSGSQYIVKLGGEGGNTSDLPIENEPEMGLEPEVGDEPEIDVDLDAEAPEIDADDTEIGADETGEEEEEDEKENPFGESVVYEIELQDDEENTNEDIVRGKGHDKEVMTITAPNKGNIESQKAPKDTDSGDNLDGGFDDEQSFADDGGTEIMAEEEEIEESEEPIEEKIQIGKGRNVTNGKTSIVGAGGKANNVGDGKVTAESIAKKYNALLKEAIQLKKENGEFKTSLAKFRDMLSETVVFNSNLAHVVRLFTEHTTTKDEKKQIIARFDGSVGSIKESQKLYKTIVSELNTKKPVTESVESKINKESGSSSKTQITESTVYVDKSTQRIKDLINRVEQR